MSMFDRMKKSLGLKQETKGHRLGGSNPEPAPAAAASGASAAPEFDIRFEEQSLGLTVAETDGHSVVREVIAGSSADKKGIRPGDRIVSLEGNVITSHNDFVAMVGAFPRPFTMRFSRKPSVSSGGGKGTSGSMFGALKGLTGSSSTTNRSSGSGGSFYKAPAPAAAPKKPLSEAEKEERRKMMVQAAKDREQQWDRRLKDSKKAKDLAGKKEGTDGKPIYDHSAAASVGNSNPETQRMVENAKRAEQMQAKNLGIDLYKPVMVGTATGAASGSMSQGSSSAQNPGGALPAAPASAGAMRTPGVAAPPQEPARLVDLNDDAFNAMEEDPYVEAAVDEAFAMMLSVPPEESERVNAALVTIEKMLANLAQKPNEAKFRSIRLLNEAFQTRVCSVPGGLELMLAAGYSLEEEFAAGTQNTATDPNVANATRLHQESGEVVTFLKHQMTAETSYRLHFTIKRIRELQEN